MASSSAPSDFFRQRSQGPNFDQQFEILYGKYNQLLRNPNFWKLQNELKEYAPNSCKYVAQSIGVPSVATVGLYLAGVVTGTAPAFLCFSVLLLASSAYCGKQYSQELTPYNDKLQELYRCEQQLFREADADISQFERLEGGLTGENQRRCSTLLNTLRLLQGEMRRMPENIAKNEWRIGVSAAFADHTEQLVRRVADDAMGMAFGR